MFIATLIPYGPCGLDLDLPCELVREPCGGREKLSAV
jgi:hypothetical protein